MCFRMSSPPRSGMLMSSTTRSKRSARSMSSTCVPLLASAIVLKRPLSCRYCFRPARTRHMVIRDKYFGHFHSSHAVHRGNRRFRNQWPALWVDHGPAHASAVPVRCRRILTFCPRGRQKIPTGLRGICSGPGQCCSPCACGASQPQQPRPVGFDFHQCATAKHLAPAPELRMAIEGDLDRSDDGHGKECAADAPRGSPGHDADDHDQRFNCRRRPSSIGVTNCDSVMCSSRKTAGAIRTAGVTPCSAMPRRPRCR